MSITTHERPGVYSSYDASALVTGSEGAKVVGLAALSTGGAAGEVQFYTSYDAAAQLGEEDRLAKLVKVLLKNGAAGVAAVPVDEESLENYQAAFDTLNGREDVKLLVCDSTSQEIQQALRDSVKAASQTRLERIAVAEGGPGESVSLLIQRAEGLNCERVVLAAPGQEGHPGELAAAVAGAIAGERDPAVPLGGAELAETSVTGRYNDNELDLLIRGGVTPVEESGGVVSVVRGVTTRVKTGGTADSTWRELTTILIVDEVIPGIRDVLRTQFQRAKNTEQTRGAIRSRVVMELEDRLNREIITDYDRVSATVLESDPTVCLVEFSFTVAHGLNQIWMTAHITV